MPITPVYPPAYNSTYVKTSTQYSASYAGYLAVNPDLFVVGASAGNSWMSSADEQNKFNIDYGEGNEFIPCQIMLENYHDSGGSTDIGVHTVYLYGTNNPDSFANTTYSDTTDLHSIAALSVSIHPSVDQSSPEIFTLSNVTTAYRYYVLQIYSNQGSTYGRGFRRVVLYADIPEVDLPVEINEGFDFNCTTEVITSGRIKINNDFGFECNLLLLTNQIKINTGFCFDCSIQAHERKNIIPNEGFGFECIVGFDAAIDIINELNMGFGFHCSMNTLTVIKAKLNYNLGFGCIFEAKKTILLSINDGFGFNCNNNIVVNYKECDLPEFSTERWC